MRKRTRRAYKNRPKKTVKRQLVSNKERGTRSRSSLRDRRTKAPGYIQYKKGRYGFKG